MPKKEKEKALLAVASQFIIGKKKKVLLETFQKKFIYQKWE